MKNRILRVVIVLGLSIILLQIWLLPENDPYFDFFIVSPDGSQIISQVTAQNNQSTIHPFVRNVMGKTVLIRIIVFGSNYLENNLTRDIEPLHLSPRSTWIIEPNSPANNENYESSWEIIPLVVNGISNWVEYLNVTLQYYEKDWQNYAWITLALV